MEPTAYLHRREGWAGSRALPQIPLGACTKLPFVFWGHFLSSGEKGVTESLWGWLDTEDGSLQHLLKTVANQPDAMEGALAEEGEMNIWVTLSKSPPSVAWSCPTSTSEGSGGQCGDRSLEPSLGLTPGWITKEVHDLG